MKKHLILPVLILIFLGSASPQRDRPDPQRNGSSFPRPKTFPMLARIGNHSSPKVDVYVIEYFTGHLSTRIIPVISLFTIAVGIPSNILILWVLIFKTKKYSIAILYIGLALSDLLFLVMLSFKVHYHLNDNNWILGEAMCKMVTAAFYGNLYCSIYIIMCIGVKRCMAIVFPFAYRTLPKRRCTILSCILVWITVTCAMLPQFMIKQSYPLSLLEITTCHDVLPLMDLPKAYLFYYLCMTLVGFFIPFLVTTLCYISIVWQLDRSDHERIYYVRMCVLVLIIFTLCFMPSNVILFIHYVKLYTSNEGNFYSYHSAAVCLCSLHSCLDPFLFVFMSRTSGYKHKRISFNGNNLSLST